MEYACELLKNEQMSVNAVAYACGFHDVLYFRRAFKKCYDLTPTEYKEQHCGRHRQE